MTTSGRCELDELTPRDQALANLRAKITEHGWTSYYVMDQIPWLYTIGICESFGQPELIVFGLDHLSAYEAASEYVDRITSAERIETGRSHRQDLLGLSVAFLQVHAEYFTRPHDYFLGWIHYYEAAGRHDVDPAARQLVWSEDGRLPWEMGFPARLSWHQPMLDLPPA